MPHPLELQLAQLRRRARQFVLCGAVARALVLVLVTGGLLALTDAGFHFQDRGLRAIVSLVWLTTITVGLRWIVAAVRESRVSHVEIAQRLERFYPQLRGNLASAVEFLAETEDDPRAGSARLRRAVIHDTARQVDELDLSQALDARPARRGLALLGVVLFGIALVAIPYGEQARIAGLRLCNPLSDVAWPRDNQLALVAPVMRLAQGQTFEVQVVDEVGAPLPDVVQMQYRFRSPDGEVSEESEPLQLVGDQLLARREGVQRSFEYRAVGGDDYTMAWTMLEVVEPPALRSISAVLHFPSYTGWPAHAVEPNFRALVGSKVELQGTATKPLASAQVQLADVTVPATISADGYKFAVHGAAEPGFVISASGPFGVDLVDHDGFHSGDQPKYEIRAVPDAPPLVDIERPKANLFLTADALLPLEIRAQDDLAVRDVTLSYLRSDHSEAGEESLALVTGPQAVSDELAAASAADGYAGDRREISHAWNLKSLDLPAGTQLTFHASAVDYAGQTGQSLPRRVTIVTSEEVEDRLADRQAVVFNELSRVLQMQENARSHVASLEVQLSETGEIKQADIDALQGAGLNQQQVDRALTSDQEGLHGQITDLLDELKMNRIDGPDTQQQMEEMLRSLAQLADGPLPDAARALTTATKSAQVDLQGKAQGTAGERNDVKQSLQAAETAQDQVVDTLSHMIDGMKQWVSFRHFHQEVGEVAKLQEQVAAETATLARKTLSRDVADLDPQQRADLQKLAQRQSELARRLDRVEQRLDDAAAAAGQEDPLVAESMNDALAHARQQRVAEGMRQAAQNVEQNRMGQAGAAQGKAAQDLRELLDILSNRRENELGRLVKKLRDAEENLAQLREQQQGLRKKLQAAEQLPDAEKRRALERLAREQRELQAAADRFGRALQRLQAERASAGLSQAGAKMGQAAESESGGDVASAASQAAAAEQDLAEAQEELARARRQAEVDLAQEQMGRMEDAIASMHERQQKLIGETMHYQLRQAERGHLTRAESASVRDLAGQQSSLRDELVELTKSLAGAEVFQFVLELASQDMTRASDRLEQRDVGDETLQAENGALQRIDQLRVAMQAESQPPPEQQTEEQEGGEGAGEQQGTPSKTHSVAELKLLKTIQEQINDRTQALLDARRASARLSAEQQAEFESLSRDQGRLADLVTNMLDVADDRPEDDPDRLPDIRQQPGGKRDTGGEQP